MARCPAPARQGPAPHTLTRLACITPGGDAEAFLPVDARYDAEPSRDRAPPNQDQGTLTRLLPVGNVMHMMPIY